MQLVVIFIIILWMKFIHLFFHTILSIIYLDSLHCHLKQEFYLCYKSIDAFRLFVFFFSFFFNRWGLSFKWRNHWNALRFLFSEFISFFFFLLICFMVFKIICCYSYLWDLFLLLLSIYCAVSLNLLFFSCLSPCICNESDLRTTREENNLLLFVSFD